MNRYLLVILLILLPLSALASPVFWRYVMENNTMYPVKTKHYITDGRIFYDRLEQPSPFELPVGMLLDDHFNVNMKTSGATLLSDIMIEDFDMTFSVVLQGTRLTPPDKQCMPIPGRDRVICVGAYNWGYIPESEPLREAEIVISEFDKGTGAVVSKLEKKQIQRGHTLPPINNYFGGGVSSKVQ